MDNNVAMAFVNSDKQIYGHPVSCVLSLGIHWFDREFIPPSSNNNSGAINNTIVNPSNLQQKAEYEGLDKLVEKKIAYYSSLATKDNSNYYTSPYIIGNP